VKIEIAFTRNSSPFLNGWDETSLVPYMEMFMNTRMMADIRENFPEYDFADARLVREEGDE
jgi:hypothetical protein